MGYRVALFAMLAIVAGGIGALLWSKPEEGRRVGIDAVRFDTTGWNRFDTSFSSMMWRSPDGDILELKWVPEFSNIMLDGDADAMRAESRRLASTNGGSLVEADVMTVAGRKAAALINRRERPSANEYIGMLFIRNGADHFTFTIVSRETGTTGSRQAGAEEPDALPPSHPLSRVRAALRSLQQTIAFQ